MTSLPVLDNVCLGCGECCRNQPFPPFLWLEEEPPEPHNTEIRRMIMLPKGYSGYRDEDQPCLWLTDDGRCKHYEIRPLVCREFEPATSDCNRLRAKIGLPRLEVPT